MAKKTELLASYIPMEMRQAIAQGTSLSEHADGVAMFADLSGFTAISEALALEYGVAHGAEQLAQLMESVFSPTIAAIHKYRGSVIGFSGDAVTCWFDNEENGNLSAQLRAIYAAKLIREGISAGSELEILPGKKFAISIKIVIVSGRVRRFVVGDSNIQKFEVIAGPTLERLSDLERVAKGGMVLVDADTYSAIENFGSEIKAEIHNGDSTFYDVSLIEEDNEYSGWPQINGLGNEQLEPWLPNIAKLHNRETALYSAFKPITSLFIQFDGIDFATDDHADELLNRLVSEVQRVAEQYSGHFVDITIGDKGSYLFVAFGALKSHENESDRALLVATELREIEHCGTILESASMGLSSGSAYVGEYGCADRRTFGVLGRDVIIAARLMELAAAGQTLVSAQVAKSASSYLFPPSSLAELKGVKERVEFHLFDPRQVPTQTARSRRNGAVEEIVGRQEEKEAIQTLLQQTLSGESTTLVIEGDAGLGKSHLIDFITESAAKRGLQVFSGAADSITYKSSYTVWKNMIVELIRRGKDSSRYSLEELSLDYVELLGKGWSDRAALLNYVIGTQLEDSQLTASMDGQVREDNTKKLLCEILLKAAERSPVVITLENGHWFDTLSASLLLALSDQARNLFIVVTRRPVEQEYAANLIYQFDTSKISKILLKPLKPDEIETLICIALGATSIDPAISEFIFEKAHGSPLFSRELVYMLRDLGKIQKKDSYYQLTDTDVGLKTQDFPLNIQGVISARIDSLPDSAQDLLKSASVIGTKFNIETLQKLQPEHPTNEASEENLELLCLNRLIVPAQSGENCYEFIHVLTQEVAYSLLLHRQRADLHEQAGLWYESQRTDDSEDYVADLAHHWSKVALERAMDEKSSTKALVYLERAAFESVNSNANKEVVDYIESALAINLRYRKVPKDNIEDELLHVTWYSLLANAHHNLGDEGNSIKAVGKGLKAAGAPLPSNSVFLIMAVFRSVAEHMASRIRKPSSKTVPVSKAELRTLDAMGMMYRNLSRALWSSNEGLLMMYANLRNLNSLERIGPSPALAVAYSHMSMTMTVLRLYKLEPWYTQKSIELGRNKGDLQKMATILVSHGVNYVGGAKWREADQILDEAIKLTAQIGDNNQWAEAMALKGDSLILRGNIHDGTALYLEIYGRSERKGSAGHAGLSLRTQALEQLEKNDLGKAVELLEKAGNIIEPTMEQLIQLDVFGMLSELYRRQGRIKEALNALESAMERINATMPPIAYPRYFGFKYSAMAIFGIIESNHQTNIDIDDQASLMKLAKKLTKHYQSYGKVFAIARPQALLCSARISLLQGNKSKWRKSLNAGIDSARELEMPDEEKCLTSYLQ